MELYVVRPGDSIYSIATQFSLPMAQIIWDNGLTNPSELVVGQVLVLRFPNKTYVVRPGDTLAQIASNNQTSVRQLLRNNPFLSGSEQIQPGQQLVLSYDQSPLFPLTVNAYSYPDIDVSLLRGVLPFLSQITPFTYGFTATGELVLLDDKLFLNEANRLGVQLVLSLSTLTEDGTFSNELAHILLNDSSIQDKLIQNLNQLIKETGYRAIEVDFEFVLKEDALPYAAFIQRLHDYFLPQSIPIIVDLAPKVFANQPGLLYEGHDYAALGQAADYVLLMTYEWGYTYGPPMAVAPIRNVRQVLDYALTEIPPEKIYLGIPAYGYDWPLPFQPGVSRANSISNLQAIDLARTYRQAIRYDEQAQSPWFQYVDEEGQTHEVWFEDARSILAKLELAQEKQLFGINYWNLNRPFPQNWPFLDSLVQIQE